MSVILNTIKENFVCQKMDSPDTSIRFGINIVLTILVNYEIF